MPPNTSTSNVKIFMIKTCTMGVAGGARRRGSSTQPRAAHIPASVDDTVLLLSRSAFWDVRGGRNRIPSNAVSSSDISSGLFLILGKICATGKCRLALLNLQTGNGRSVKWTIRRASPERGS